MCDNCHSSSHEEDDCPYPEIKRCLVGHRLSEHGTCPHGCVSAGEDGEVVLGPVKLVEGVLIGGFYADKKRALLVRPIEVTSAMEGTKVKFQYFSGPTEIESLWMFNNRFVRLQLVAKPHG